MNRTVFVFGPSDTQEQNAETTTSAGPGLLRVEADLSGVLPILPFVMSDKKLGSNCQSLLIGVQKIRLPANAHVNLFNLVGDADSSSNMLRNIQVIESKIRPRRFFNKPGDVFKTARAHLPKTLDNIPGCHVPRVESVNPSSFAELKAACTEFGSWPMIIRARGYHGGKYMLLLTEPSQLESNRATPWLYQGIHLIEFVDYMGGDGLYQKNRVIMIDGTAYPRHSIISDRWAIHSGSRIDLMDHNRELCHREERHLAHLRETARGEYQQIFAEVQRRIGLDVFGIDFALVDRQVVIFEANACMNFLNQDYGHDRRYQYLENQVNVLKRSLRKMLLQA